MSPVSKAQLRWAHTPTGEKALGSARVAEWDKESKGVSLPERSKGGGQKIESMLRPLKGKNA
jgi:hypothetical protein